MKKHVPAVFFQKHLNGVKNTFQKPERLELFENELRDVVGGMSKRDIETYSFDSTGVAHLDDSGI